MMGLVALCDGFMAIVIIALAADGHIEQALVWAGLAVLVNLLLIRDVRRLGK